MLVPLRIGTPLRPMTDSDTTNLWIRSVFPRDDKDKGVPKPAIIIGSIAILLILLILLYGGYRRTTRGSRLGREQNSESRGRSWFGSRSARSNGYEQSSNADTRYNPSGSRHMNTDSAVAELNNTTNRNSQATVDRNTSIRSVMTLPAYRNKPAENEQVLGREGERDGVDIVIERPTEEHDEELRDMEMEQLYQIRVARRQEIEEREERRRLRREARSRNDLAALEEIRARTRAASNASNVDDLRVEHNRIKQQRQRAVSSVSYHDVGVARHDGTRIRANSTESERVGLLSDAASIAASTRDQHRLSTDNGSSHRRGRSASSVLSIDSNGDFPSPGLVQPHTRSRANSGATLTPHYSPDYDRAGSSPEIIEAAEADIGDTEMPPHSPPGYDDVDLSDRSGFVTPVHHEYNEPPPDYSTMDERERRMIEEALRNVREGRIPTEGDGDLSNRDSGEQRSGRGVGGVPQLPSLRIRGLPQIVVEPDSARPRSRERR